jgi:undecaprenyl-diphosphatase
LEYFKYILYGLIQGLTEFIPVSSTAHLKVIPHFFGVDEPGTSLSAIIQSGSVFALIWYFKNDIFNLRRQYSKKNFYYLLNERLFRSILIGTIPIILLGGAIKLFVPYFFDNILRSNLSIALVSLLMAFFMYLADRTKKGTINLKNYNYSDIFWVGLSQAFAIFPGVSRSGVTISTALLTGWERADAVKFSFLLGLPAISFAGIFELISSFNKFSSLSFYPLIVGLITSFLSSLFAIYFLVNYFSSNGLKIFILYRVVFGFLILLNL